MRPTSFRPLALALVTGLAALLGSSPAVLADGPAWERPMRQGIADQDAEIARTSAKAVASRLESQSSRNRNDLVVLYLLARAYGKDERRADAITAYGEALAIEPGCWFAWRDRGVLRWLAGDPRAAEQDLRQAATLSPRLIEALQPLGALLIEQKRYAEGIVILTRALDVDPGLDSARLQIAEAFAAMGHPDRALLTVAQLLAKAPNDPTLRFARAKYLVARSEFGEAQKIFRQLAQENPNNARPLHGWIDAAMKAKTLDADEGVWVLERLRRLARTREEQERITKQIDELRRQAAAAAAPPAPRTGPPGPEDLARALRAPEAKVREAVIFYILTETTPTFTITGDLTQALIEQLAVRQGDEPAQQRARPGARARGPRPLRDTGLRERRARLAPRSRRQRASQGGRRPRADEEPARHRGAVALRDGRRPRPRRLGAPRGLRPRPPPRPGRGRELRGAGGGVLGVVDLARGARREEGRDRRRAHLARSGDRRAPVPARLSRRRRRGVVGGVRRARSPSCPSRWVRRAGLAWIRSLPVLDRSAGVGRGGEALQERGARRVVDEAPVSVARRTRSGLVSVALAAALGLFGRPDARSAPPAAGAVPPAPWELEVERETAAQTSAIEQAKVTRTIPAVVSRFENRVGRDASALNEYLLGRAQYYAGNPTAAKASMERCLRADPKFHFARSRLALLLVELKNYADAEAQLQAGARRQARVSRRRSSS